MVNYNKLVRDKIPDIIKNQGETPLTRILPEDEYLQRLDAKLNEEVGEYQESKAIEELADILEVVFDISEARGCTTGDLMDVYREKHEKRGGFAKRILLISKE